MPKNEIFKDKQLKIISQGDGRSTKIYLGDVDITEQLRVQKIIIKIEACEFNSCWLKVVPNEIEVSTYAQIEEELNK